MGVKMSRTQVTLYDDSELKTAIRAYAKMFKVPIEKVSKMKVIRFAIAHFISTNSQHLN